MDWHGAIALLFSFLFLNLDDDLQKTPTSFNTGRPRVPRAGKRPEHRRPGRARRGPPGDDRGHPRRGGVAAPAAGLDGAKVFFLSFFLFCFFDAPLRSPPLSPSTLFFLALFCPPPLSFSLSRHPPPPPKKKKTFAPQSDSMGVAQMGLAAATARFKRVFESPARRRSAVKASGFAFLFFCLLYFLAKHH